MSEKKKNKTNLPNSTISLYSFFVFAFFAKQKAVPAGEFFDSR
jgi:hypothetical protein